MSTNNKTMLQTLAADVGYEKAVGERVNAHKTRVSSSTADKHKKADKAAIDSQKRVVFSEVRERYGLGGKASKMTTSQLRAISGEQKKTRKKDKRKMGERVLEHFEGDLTKEQYEDDKTYWNDLYRHETGLETKTHSFG